MASGHSTFADEEIQMQNSLARFGEKTELFRANWNEIEHKVTALYSRRTASRENLGLCFEILSLVDALREAVLGEEPGRAAFLEKYAGLMGPEFAGRLSLKGTKDYLDKTVDMMRKLVQRIARPFVGNSGMKDLSDEILIKIFGFVRGSESISSEALSPGEQAGVRDIDNVRLACKRFSKLARRI